MNAARGATQEMHGPRAVRIDDRRSSHTWISPRARLFASHGEGRQ